MTRARFYIHDVSQDQPVLLATFTTQERADDYVRDLAARVTMVEVDRADKLIRRL